jgi:hypothetical protein
MKPEERELFPAYFFLSLLAVLMAVLFMAVLLAMQGYMADLLGFWSAPDLIYSIVGILFLYFTPKWFVKSKGYMHPNPFFPFQVDRVASIFFYLTFTIFGFFVILWFGLPLLIELFWIGLF